MGKIIKGIGLLFAGLILSAITLLALFVFIFRGL